MTDPYQRAQSLGLGGHRDHQNCAAAVVGRDHRAVRAVCHAVAQQDSQQTVLGLLGNMGRKEAGGWDRAGARGTGFERDVSCRLAKNRQRFRSIVVMKSSLIRVVRDKAKQASGRLSRRVCGFHHSRAHITRAGTLSIGQITIGICSGQIKKILHNSIDCVWWVRTNNACVAAMASGAAKGMPCAQ